MWSMPFISLFELPTEILGDIFKYLSYSDLRNVMLTCRTLQNIVLADNSTWRYINGDMLTINNATNKCMPSYSWYNKCRISHNWHKGIFRDKIILQHGTNYMPWLTMQDHVLLISVGSELRCYPTSKKGLPLCKEYLWRIEVPIILRNDIRTNDISRFKVKGSNIACGNRDGCIAVYQFDNLQHRPQLVQHIYDCHQQGKVEVTAVELIVSDGKLSSVISASNNVPCVKFWSTNCEYTNIYNNNSSYCVREVAMPACVGARCLDLASDQSTMAIGLNGNNAPVLLDVETGAILMTSDNYKDHRNAIRDIQWHNENTIAYVTYSGCLRMIDTRCSRTIYYMRDPLGSTSYCVKTDGHKAIIVGTAQYSRCVLFDTRSQLHVQMYFTQKRASPVYSLDFDSSKLITAADKSVATLDFNISVGTTTPRDYSDRFEM